MKGNIVIISWLSNSNYEYEKYCDVKSSIEPYENEGLEFIHAHDPVWIRQTGGGYFKSYSKYMYFYSGDMNSEELRNVIASELTDSYFIDVHGEIDKEEYRELIEVYELEDATKGYLRMIGITYPIVVTGDDYDYLSTLIQKFNSNLELMMDSIKYYFHELFGEAKDDAQQYLSSIGLISVLKQYSDVIREINNSLVVKQELRELLFNIDDKNITGRFLDYRTLLFHQEKPRIRNGNKNVLHPSPTFFINGPDKLIDMHRTVDSYDEKEKMSVVSSEWIMFAIEDIYQLISIWKLYIEQCTDVISRYS